MEKVVTTSTVQRRIGKVVNIVLLPSTGTTHSSSVDEDPGIYTALTQLTLEDANGMPDATLS